MAYTADGTTQYLSFDQPVTEVPLTFAAWFYPTANANGNLVYVGLASTPDRIQLSMRNDRFIQCYTQSGGLFPAAVSSSQAPLNNWSHACGVVASNASRRIYLNGGSSTINTVSLPAQGSFNSAQIFARTASSSVGTFFQGSIAEVGIWSAALTAAEIASLAKGMTCDKVRPQSLVFYAPLVRDLIDQKGGLAITNNNGATVSTHPKIYP
jgi:hypothetical protein